MGDVSVGVKRPGDPVTTGLHLQVLGPLRVWRDGCEVPTGPRQQMLLLALLLVNYGRPVSTDELIDAIWGDAAPMTAVNIVHKYVGSTRRLLEPDLDVRADGQFLHRRGASYVLTVGENVLDVKTFRALVERGESLRHDSHPEDSLDAHLAALQQWSGPAGSGLEGGVGADTTFAALNAEFLNTCGTAANLAIELGQSERALPHLRLASGMFPLHEPTHANLIRVLGDAGERAEALAQFERIRRRLAADLGLEPGRALSSAQLHVLRSGPDHDRGAASDRLDPLLTRRAVGLEPHRVLDFSGRVDEITTIRSFANMPSSRPEHVRVLLVGGPPGIGKTTTTLEALYALEGRDRLFVNLHGFDPSPLEPVQILQTLLAQVHRGEDPPGSLDEAASAWGDATRTRPLVVVLDNAATEGQVRPVLAADPQTVIIVTSRRALAGVEAVGRVSLGPLERRDSTEMLKAIIQPGRAQLDELDELAQLCGDMPLALRIAGARIAARPQWAVADFASRLRDETGRLSQLTAGDLAVDRAFSLSYDAMPATLRRLFRSLALLHGRTFSARMVAAIDGMSTHVCRDRLDELADLGILEVARGDRFRLHDLIRLYANQRLRDETSADDIDRQQRRLNRWTLDMTAMAARAFPSVWESTVLPNASTEEELAKARAWLMDESDHWYGALKDAARAADHRVVVDATMALMRISNDWWNWGDWSEVHLMGAAAAAALGDHEAAAAQTIAAGSAIIGDSPDDADEGEAAAYRSREAAQRSRDPQWTSWSRIQLASSHMARGNWNAALEETRKSASEFAERGDLSGELEAHYWTLSILRRTESEIAVEEAERLLDVIDDLGDRPEKHVIPVTLFNILLEATAIMRNSERFDDVLLLTDRIVRLPEPYFVRGGYAAQAMKQRGLALLSLRRIDEASDALQLALRYAGSYLPDWWADPIEDALAAIRDSAKASPR